ncbi:uncharacterized protein LOC126840146 [Adelges cooleyi]|uniref:uncharacterized protein LOC126840146 n=1 Tax=Adelges cooleyi TaxID=133065 RepID=UPI002180487E|nr:uncharacterized protein LOC126840146 [Adelges cooleyi]
MPKMALRFKCTASVITLLSALVNVADCGLGHTTCFKASTSDSEPNPYQHILQFNRGQFQRIQWLTAPNLNQDYSVLTASEIGKEIKCNDAYYTLRYLYMTNPRNFSDRNQVFAIHKAINEQYSGWTMKMLATSFNVAQNDIEMDVPWLMYLYINWIEERTANYVGSEMRTFIQLAHDGMIKAVETAMQDNDCTMFFPEVEGVPVSERKFSEYKVGMDNWRPTNDNKENADAVSAVLGEHYTDVDENSGLYCFQEFLDTLPAGPVPGVRPVTQESLTANSLYLNGVFANERHSKGFTLTTQFEVLVHGKDFNDYLTERIEKVKNGSTLSFREYIINLSWIHMHVRSF